MKDGLDVALTIITYGFTIGILACRIGFTIGRLIMQATESACTFLGPRFALLLGALLGGFGGSVLSLMIVPASCTTLSSLMSSGLFGATISAAFTYLLLQPRWSHFVGFVRLIHEIVVIAELITIFSLNLASTITTLLLKSTHTALHLSEHLSLDTLLPQLVSTAAPLLFSSVTISALQSVTSMFKLFFTEAMLAGDRSSGVTSLPAAFSKLAEVHARCHNLEAPRSSRATRSLHASNGRAPRGKKYKLGQLAVASVCEGVNFGDDIRRYVRYSVGTYGQLGLKFLGVVPYGAASDSQSAFTYCSGNCDVVMSNWQGEMYKQGFVLAIDRERRKIVLSIRGTIMPQDFVTDLCCKGVEVEVNGVKGMAHEGMLKSALVLDEELRNVVCDLAEAKRYKDFKVVLTGHSLGAGVAGILLGMWQEEDRLREKMTCFGFGTPCIFSPEIARSLDDRMVTVVLEDDMVPRFSLSSAKRMREAARKLWKSEEEGEEWKGELDDLYDEEDVEQLCAPGTIVWMDALKSGKEEEEGVDTAKIEVVVVEDPTAYLRDLRISKQMFAIHVPQNYFFRCSDAWERLASGSKVKDY